MEVNGISFLMTISKYLKFGLAGKLNNMENTTIMKHFKSVFRVYSSPGFVVTIILANNQFKSIRGKLADIDALINVVSHTEHVPEAEGYNRTIKEPTCSQYNIMPFKYYPPIMIIELLYSQVFWCNMFALQGGVSLT